MLLVYLTVVYSYNIYMSKDHINNAPIFILSEKNILDENNDIVDLFSNDPLG